MEEGHGNRGKHTQFKQRGCQSVKSARKVKVIVVVIQKEGDGMEGVTTAPLSESKRSRAHLCMRGGPMAGVAVLCCEGGGVCGCVCVVGADRKELEAVGKR